MKPVEVASGDPLDRLMDLAANPEPGDDRRASKLESLVYREQETATDFKAFDRSISRAIAAKAYRIQICEQLA